MAHMMIDGSLPANLLNHAFYLLAAEHSSQVYAQAWFSADGAPRLRAAQAFLQLDKNRRANLPAAEPNDQIWTHQGATASNTVGDTTTTSKSRKPIEHYLLLPLFEWGVARWHLTIIQEYVEAYLPTIGFSLEQAKLAHRVTVIGNPQGVSTKDVHELEAAGCYVERISGETGAETQLLLQQLAQNKQHS
jgi:hypothetical protein